MSKITRKNFIKGTTASLATVALSSLSPSAFATEAYEDNISENVNILQMLATEKLSINKLNEVAKLPPSQIQQSRTFVNPTVVEIRELQLSEEYTLVNTRTVTTYSDYATKTDSYGLYWGGVQGWGGTLVASYDYKHVNIMNPNQMDTQIFDAYGRVDDILDAQYDVENIYGAHDYSASENAKGTVTFIVETKTGFIWQEAEYKHNCQFDRYGVAHMSWF